MFIKLIRFLRGYVRFEVLGRFPERFMNLCMRQGRLLFDAGPDNGVFKGCLFLSDYKEIRSVARRSGVKLRVCERHGLPFALKKYKERKGLLAGAVLFLVVSLVMQNFVWSLDINGVESLSETYLRSVLKKYGVYEGAYMGSIDFAETELRLMQEIEEIGWMSINNMGTSIEIEIQEKEQVPNITPSDVPCNIKAERDGIILSMNIKNGSTKLSPGSAVIKGQLLVSGVTVNALNLTHFVHADALITAQTWHSVTETVTKSGVYSKPCDTVKRSSLKFLWFSLPCSLSSVKGTYTSRVESKRLNLNSKTLLVGKDTEYCTIYKDCEYMLTKEKTDELLNIKDYMYRLFTLSECTEITASSSVSETDDKATLYIKYTCVEDIAHKENIIVN